MPGSVWWAPLPAVFGTVTGASDCGSWRPAGDSHAGAGWSKSGNRGQGQCTWDKFPLCSLCPGKSIMLAPCSDFYRLRLLSIRPFSALSAPRKSSSSSAAPQLLFASSEKTFYKKRKRKAKKQPLSNTVSFEVLLTYYLGDCTPLRDCTCLSGPTWPPGSLVLPCWAFLPLVVPGQRHGRPEIKIKSPKIT